MHRLQNKKIIVMIGMPGSGKSTLAQKISARTNHVHLSSDKIRNILFGETHFTNCSPKEHNHKNTLTYKILQSLAQALIQCGSSVIIDCTNTNTSKRKAMLEFFLQFIEETDIVYVVHTIEKHIIEQRLTSDDSLDDAYFKNWQNVYSYFEECFNNQTASWPTEDEGIDIILADSLRG